MAEHPAPLRRIPTGSAAGTAPQWQRPAVSETNVSRPPLPQSPPPEPAAPQERWGTRWHFVVFGTLLGLLTVGVIGIGAAFAFRTLLGHEDRATAAYAPADSYAYIAINTDRRSQAWLDAWNMARDLGLDDDLAELPKEAARQAGLDPSLWEEPLRPAIGDEVGVAVWPTAGATSEPHMALLVQIGDGAAAEAAIPVLLEDDAPVAATYRGVTYYTGAANASAAGIIDDVLAFTSSVAAFEQVVDARRDGALDQVAAFTTAAERAAASPLLFAYIDTTAIGALVDDALAENVPTDLPAEAFQLEEWGQVTITLKAEDNALRLSSRSSARPAASPDFGSGARLDAFSNEMPANLFMLLAGHDLYATVWQPISEQMAQLNDALGDSGEMGSAAMLDMVSMVGFDLDGGFFGQMRGDYALGAALSGVGTVSGADVRFFAHVDDPAVVAATLAEMADMVALSGVPLERDANGFSLSTAGVEAVVRLEGDTLRMIVSYQSEGATTGTLAADPTFRRAVDALPETSGFAGYVAFHPLMALLPPGELADLDPQARALLEALSAMAFSAGNDGDGMRGDILLLFNAGE